MGDDILQKKARPVTEFNASLHQLLDDMWDTLHFHDALGLAAPQVGVLRRVVIVELEDEDTEERTPYEFVNPTILASSDEKANTEGCLSVDKMHGDVSRPTRVTLQAQDRHGEPFELEAEDTLAIAISHEMDHLEGILFLDKAENIVETNDDDPPPSRRKRFSKKKRR